MRNLSNKTLILLLILPALVLSCNLDKWEYPHLLDPKDYEKYYDDLNILRATLLEKGYEYEPYGKHTALHETWEQEFDKYSSTIIIKFEDPDGKYNDDPISSFEAWITTDGEAENSPEFKQFIENYLTRIKQNFPVINTQEHDSSYRLILSNESRYSVSISNDLKQGSQYIVVVSKE